MASWRTSALLRCDTLAGVCWYSARPSAKLGALAKAAAAIRAAVRIWRFMVCFLVESGLGFGVERPDRAARRASVGVEVGHQTGAVGGGSGVAHFGTAALRHHRGRALVGVGFTGGKSRGGGERCSSSGGDEDISHQRAGHGEFPFVC